MFLRIAAGVLIVAGVATPFVARKSAADVTLAEVQATVERTQTVTCTLIDKTVPPSKERDESSRLLITGRISSASSKPTAVTQSPTSDGTSAC